MRFSLARGSIPAYGNGKSLAGWAVIRTRYFHVFVTCLPARKVLFQQSSARRASLRFLLAYFFSVGLFLVFSPRATSKAVEDGERPPTNARRRPARREYFELPLFASISTSSTKIEMQGNWKMESTLSGDSFVPFVRGFRVENGFELEN